MSSNSAPDLFRAGTPSRLQQLDLLRGLAILLVLFHHSGGLVAESGAFAKFYAPLQRFGWTGVDLFFVLSGFLIGGILFREIKREGRLHVGRFLLRRAFKIWPGYLVLIAFAFLKDSHHATPPVSLGELLRTYWANLLHLQNYFPNIRFHTWSLAVEEHFYLILPMLLGTLSLGSAARVRRWFLPLAVLVVCSIALLRCVHGILVPFTYETQMYPTHLRLDSLLMGVILAHIATFFPSRFARMQANRRLFLVCGIALVLPMFWLDLDRSLFVQTAGFSLLYLGYAAILIAALGTKPGYGVGGRILTSPAGKLISTIGLFSYGIYLWHIDLAVRPSVKIAAKLQSRVSPTMASVAALACCIALACVAGIVMTFLVERPALALRDWLVPADENRKKSGKQARSEPHDDAVSPVLPDAMTQKV